MTIMTDQPALTLAEDFYLAAVRTDPDRFGYLVPDSNMARRPLPGDPHLPCDRCGSVTSARVFSGPDVVCADTSQCYPPLPAAEAEQEQPEAGDEGEAAEDEVTGPDAAEDAPEAVLDSAAGRS